MFCHNCGRELKEQAKFCPHCGAGVYDPVSQTAAEPAAPKENVALGTLGACVGGLLGIGVFLLCCAAGIYPAFVGILMAAAVVAGYDLLSKCRGTAGNVIVIALVAAVPLVAYVLNCVWMILGEYENLGLTLLDGVGLLFLFVAQGSLDIGMMLQELLTLYGFTALGTVLAFWWSQRRNHRFDVG